MYVASNGIKTAVILRDPDPINPREWDNVGKMICWHGRYNLGDNHQYKDVSYFASEMANKLVDLRSMLGFIQTGKTADLRLVPEDDHLRLQFHYQFGKNDGNWYDSRIAVTNDLKLLDGVEEETAKEDILDSCWPKEVLQMCIDADQLAILPLYLYDHSGLAMSTGSFIGRAHHAEWDSGQVGYVYMTKETAMKELSEPMDTLRIAKVFSEENRELTTFSREAGEKVDDVLEKNGFQPVHAAHIRNLYDSVSGSEGQESNIDEYQLRHGGVYKKDNYLYVFAGHEQDGDFKIARAAVYNPDLKPLSEQNWHSRAEQCLEAEVHEYDNYLQGEVYGFRAFEGREEIDSCWGYNPGDYDTRTFFDDMFGEWGAELKSKMLYASYEPGEDFDIDNYFEIEDFPDFRSDIHKTVIDYIQAQAMKEQLWPYAMSAQAILANEENALDNITDSLYEQHVFPRVALVDEACKEHAGVSRDYMPTIDTKDMDEGKRYTLDDLLALVKEKGKTNAEMQSAASIQIDREPEL